MFVLKALEGTTARWREMCAAEEEELLMRVRWGRTAAVRRVLFEAAVAKALEERAGKSRNMFRSEEVVRYGEGEKGEGRRNKEKGGRRSVSFLLGMQNCSENDWGGYRTQE